LIKLSALQKNDRNLSERIEKFDPGFPQTAKSREEDMTGKRNKLLIRFGMILLGFWSFFIYGFNKAEGAEWQLFQATSAGNIYYYDGTSVERFSNDILRVWVRIIETKGFSKADLEKLKDPKKGIEVAKEAQKKATSEWKQLFEINCSARMVRVLSATLYDMEGKVKESYELPSEWTPIAENSVTNYLAKILCL
jgi:hypothetical protein